MPVNWSWWRVKFIFNASFEQETLTLYKYLFKKTQNANTFQELMSRYYKKALKKLYRYFKYGNTCFSSTLVILIFFMFCLCFIRIILSCKCISWKSCILSIVCFSLRFQCYYISVPIMHWLLQNKDIW